MWPRIEPALLCGAALTHSVGLIHRTDLDGRCVPSSRIEPDPIIRDGFLAARDVYPISSRHLGHSISAHQKAKQTPGGGPLRD